MVAGPQEHPDSSRLHCKLIKYHSDSRTFSSHEEFISMTLLLQVWAAVGQCLAAFLDLQGLGPTTDLAGIPILKFKAKMTKFKFLPLG